MIWLRVCYYQQPYPFLAIRAWALEVIECGCRDVFSVELVSAAMYCALTLGASRCFTFYVDTALSEFQCLLCEAVFGDSAIDFRDQLRC